MAKKIVIAYTRAIAGEIDHNTQLEKIEAFCFARDWIIVDYYSDSEVSTTGSEAMFNAIEAAGGEIGTVVFYSRAAAPTLLNGAPLYNVMYFNPACDYGVSFGISFAAVTGELDTTTADGKLAVNLSRHIFTMVDDLIGDNPNRKLDKSTPEGRIIEELMGLRVVWIALKNDQWGELDEWIEEEEVKEARKGNKVIKIRERDDSVSDEEPEAQ